MSISYLTSAMMIAVGHDLLNNPSKLSILERDALTTAYIEPLRAVQKELVVLTTDDGEVKARLKEVSEELAAQDQIHDRLARGIFRGLECAADLAATPEEAEPYVRVRELLFPQELAINTLGYMEQGGNVLAVKSRATPAVREVLRSVCVGAHTLEEAFDAWVANGEAMSARVAERAALSGDEDDTRVSAGDLHQARLRWMRVVKALVAALDMLDVDEDERRRLLATLHEAEVRATKAREIEVAGREKGQEEGGQSPEAPADPVVDGEVEERV